MFFYIEDLIGCLVGLLTAAPVQIAAGEDDESVSFVLMLANDTGVRATLDKHHEDCDDLVALASRVLAESVTAWALWRMRWPKSEPEG